MNKKTLKKLHEQAIGYAINCRPQDADLPSWSKRKDFKVIYRAYKNGMLCGYPSGFVTAIKAAHKILLDSNQLDSCEILEVKFSNALTDKNNE